MRRGDIAIREATIDDAQAIARVHVDTWRTQYVGIVPQDYLDGLSYEQSASRWANWLNQSRGESAYYVAVDETGEVVGFASGSNNRETGSIYTGELLAIYVVQSSQGRGAGRQLLKAVARALSTKGHTSMSVWVLTQNPARRFYESLGGKLVKVKTVEIGGVALEETQYGWEDIFLLLA